MRKSILKLGVLGLFLFSVFFINVTEIDAQSSSTWYEVEYTTSITSSGIYLVTTCTNIQGSACNMPGSVHRTDLSPIISRIGV
ncbi:hypothetical protein E4S40_08555 [Algoriphagus kandeliae]|uniref:Uncharacterized protein n=1 Tax=Algoriphagus kandeliae TaxID=2562278 RepID=A0A4Y9QY41_9BACT|nr:hypothetical protein [Algoriphagus kandeliae]TFV96263.1 hypothetical protein E4S40_08555 [Algoriphagus kandeliae]